MQPGQPDSVDDGWLFDEGFCVIKVNFDAVGRVIPDEIRFADSNRKYSRAMNVAE